LTLQNQNPTRLQTSLSLRIPPLTNIILSINRLNILTIHQVIPHHNIKPATKKTRILTPRRNRSLLIIQRSTIQLPHNKFITTPLIRPTIRLKHPKIILHRRQRIKRPTQNKIISIHTQRSIPLQRLLNPPRIHPRLTLSPRTQLHTNSTITRHQPTRNIMSKQRRLPRTRRLIHHNKLTIRRLQTTQHLTRSPLLPRSRLPTKIPQPKKTKISQSPLRLNTQRLINNNTSNNTHTQNRSSLQTRRPLITPLKPIRRRHTQPRPTSSSLHPQTPIPRNKKPTPTLNINPPQPNHPFHTPNEKNNPPTYIPIPTVPMVTSPRS